MKSNLYLYWTFNYDDKMIEHSSKQVKLITNYNIDSKILWCVNQNKSDQI